MPGLSFTEIIIVFILLLILFGPKELPKLAKLFVSSLNELKNIFYKLREDWELKSEDNKKQL